MKIYIAGDLTSPDYKKIVKKATWWILFGGHEPVNVTDMMTGANFTEEQITQIGLTAVKECDGVYMTRGWESSESAVKIKEYADAYHIPIWQQR